MLQRLSRAIASNLRSSQASFSEGNISRRYSLTASVSQATAYSSSILALHSTPHLQRKTTRTPSQTPVIKQFRREAIYHEIADYFAKYGGKEYQMGGENITQQDHALQGAFIAMHVGAPPYFVVAQMLHDIGYLFAQLDPNASLKGINTRHEFAGEQFMRDRGFPKEVVDLTRMHVDAKRYLVATDPHYYEQLSEESKRTLLLQGGTMNAADCRQFEAKGDFQGAIILRKIEEGAKFIGLETPGLDAFKTMIITVLSGEPDTYRSKNTDWQKRATELHQLMTKNPGQFEQEIRSLNHPRLLSAYHCNQPQQQR
jgi:predicted HD phosphohydrolase